MGSSQKLSIVFKFCFYKEREIYRLLRGRKWCNLSKSTGHLFLALFPLCHWALELAPKHSLFKTRGSPDCRHLAGTVKGTAPFSFVAGPEHGGQPSVCSSTQAPTARAQPQGRLRPSRPPEIGKSQLLVALANLTSAHAGLLRLGDKGTCVCKC